MSTTRQNACFSIDGYKVSATFAEAGNSTAIGRVKQILLSSFVAGTPVSQPKGILDGSPKQRDNSSEDSPHVP